MTTVKSACAALTAVLCTATMTGSAEAKGFPGGHMAAGHVSHIGHAGHFGHGHWGHHHGWYGPAFGVGLYEPYYSSYGDCYRVIVHHRWRTVCD